jgi:hypothetical protein
MQSIAIGLGLLLLGGIMGAILATTVTGVRIMFEKLLKADRHPATGQYLSKERGKGMNAMLKAPAIPEQLSSIRTHHTATKAEVPAPAPAPAISFAAVLKGEKKPVEQTEK